MLMAILPGWPLWMLPPKPSIEEKGKPPRPGSGRIDLSPHSGAPNVFVRGGERGALAIESSAEGPADAQAGDGEHPRIAADPYFPQSDVIEGGPDDAQQ